MSLIVKLAIAEQTIKRQRRQLALLRAKARRFYILWKNAKDEASRLRWPDNTGG